MLLTTGVLNSHNRICLSPYAEVSDESRVIGHTNDIILSSAHIPKEAVYQATKMKGGEVDAIPYHVKFPTTEEVREPR